jgi:prepilin-type N-terminal cleavage/methylation domain-containing protein
MTATSVQQSRGFTLVELSIVMVIFALMMGGIMMTLSAQRDTQQRAKTIALLTDATDTLKGYAAANGRVPCPSITAIGVESPAGGTCTQAAGFYPITLGIDATDAWGRPLRYAVATSYLTPDLPNPPIPSSDRVTTVSGLRTARISPEGTTDLRACASATGSNYVISGAAACPGVTVAAGLVVAVWSDGADTTTPDDDLAAWLAVPTLAMQMMIGGY